jgi:hypothetical protein
VPLQPDFSENSAGSGTNVPAPGTLAEEKKKRRDENPARRQKRPYGATTVQGLDLRVTAEEKQFLTHQTNSREGLRLRVTPE